MWSSLSARAPIEPVKGGLFPQLLPHLQSGMLLLCDRGFFSYKLWKSVVSRGYTCWSDFTRA